MTYPPTTKIQQRNQTKKEGDFSDAEKLLLEKKVHTPPKPETTHTASTETTETKTWGAGLSNRARNEGERLCLVATTRHGHRRMTRRPAEWPTASPPSPQRVAAVARLCPPRSPRLFPSRGLGGSIGSYCNGRIKKCVFRFAAVSVKMEPPRVLLTHRRFAREVSAGEQSGGHVRLRDRQRRESAGMTV